MKRFLIHIILSCIVLIPHASAKQHLPELRPIPVTRQEIYPAGSPSPGQACYGTALSKEIGEQMTLTNEEAAYLRSHPVIRVNSGTGGHPFDCPSMNTPHGYSIDLLHILEKKLGVHFQFIRDHSWKGVMKKFKNQEIDLIQSAVITRDAEVYTRFTDHYLSYRNGFVVSQEAPDITSIDELRNATIAVPQDSAQKIFLKSNYPGIKLIHTRANEDALGLVMTGADIGLTVKEQHGPNDINERNQIITGRVDASNNIKTSLPKGKKLYLTAREQAYLKNKGVVKMSVMPDWLPYESIDETGNHVGIVADLIKIIENRIGIPIELIPTKDWGASLQNLRERRCDILTIAMNVPSRIDDMIFTRPYIVEPFVIATRNRELFIKDARDIGNRKVGIIEDYAFTEVLKQRYPDLQIVHVQNAKDGLERVRSEKLFGFIDSMPTIGYTLQENAMLDLKIAGKLEFDLELTIASRSDQPLLSSIMQKATDAITEEERREIIGNWLSIKFEQGVDYRLFRRFLAGGIVIILGIGFWNRKLMSEIRKRKEAESHLKYARQAALAASKAKGDFLANMSHEIRTPMNAIIGMSSLALNKDYPEDALGYFKHIHTSGQSLLTIINDVLDFSKIEAGKIEIENTPFSLRDLLEQITIIFEPLATQKQIRLTLVVDETIDEHLMGDPTRIKQILTNFTSNAVKFTDKGSVTIEARAIRKDDAFQQIRISVIDTGKGIHDTDHKKLFEAFTQEDVSTTRTYGGTGLGLTISKVLTELMGGAIGMESEPEMGSTFHITLNLATTNVLHIDGDTMVTSHIHNARILIVDDDSQARELLKETIKEFSFTLDEASSPDEAIRKLEMSTEPYDLMLLDWKMPRQNGPHFYNALKQRKKNITLPKAIIISAYDNPDMLREAREAGIVSIFRKPVKSSELLVGIVNALGKQVLIKHSEKGQIELNRIRFKGQTVLLVEDNDLNQDVCKEILETVHLNVIIANNGQEGVTKFKEGHETISLVIMDLQMPVMDGYGAARAIRRLAIGKKVPIIALSADAVAGTREKVQAGGMNDYKTKPIVPQQLISTLSKFLTHETVTPDHGKSAPGNGQIEGVNGEEVFPDIPGLDIAQGISNRMGNAENYKNALLKFAGNYKNYISGCQTAFIKNDFKTLTGQLHMFKGVSGNLQATDIHRLTAGIEAMAKEHHPACGEELEKLQKQVSTLCAQIEHGLALPSHGPGESGCSALSNEAMVEALASIIPLLEESDTRARKLLEQLLYQQPPNNARKDIERAVAAMNVYDFDGAMVHIKAIHKS
ncbi:response regulator [Desulfobacter sp.]